jgi:hypothetical protein
MASEPAWTTTPPSAYDIVACWYPESDTPDEPGPDLRPALVIKVLQGKTTGSYACDVAYGTKTLKIIKRQTVDLIIEHPHTVGLPRPTRFDLDQIARLPWGVPFFGTWEGYKTPKIGELTEPYIRDYAYIMIKRKSV